MENFFLIFELAGTVAFTISGVMTGLEKRMDIFGISILGLTTAVGGGVIRDLVLGNTPPDTFKNPNYAVISLVTTTLLLLPGIRNVVMKSNKIYNLMLFIGDTIGLGIFTVAGVRTACYLIPSPSVFLLIFVGTVTGVGGGVLRDIMAGNTPYIFRKHVYASASLAGALLCALLWRPAGQMIAMIAGMALIILIRALSAHYRWNLPYGKSMGDKV